MKQLILVFVIMLSLPFAHGQDITDALRYSQGEIKGSARFRAMGGAFGALGGDLSAVNINPAGSAIFNRSSASISLKNYNQNNDTNFFNSINEESNSKVNLNQGGAAFVFNSRKENSRWKKFAFSIAYDTSKNYNNSWIANGTNTKNSIADYFLVNAQGLELGQIARFDDETFSEAYSEIGNANGFQYQQAFLGYESFIIEAFEDDDTNTDYFSNIAPGDYDQIKQHTSSGNNGKMAFNLGAQYSDKLYFGLNLNSHFLNYNRSTFFTETNNNVGSIVNRVEFNNRLSTIGNGFSLQLGTIYKITKKFRTGLSYASPTWFSIEEENAQSIQTAWIDTNDNDSINIRTINPEIVNVFPAYRLQTPSKLTGSLAYIFGSQGLLSFDYSIKDYSNTKFKPTSDSYFAAQNTLISNTLTMASTYRIGGEYKIKRVSLRGGYRFEESPYKDKIAIGDLSGYSLGLGYSFGNTTLDFAYDGSQQASANQLFNAGLTDTINFENTAHNFTLTLAFKL